MTNSWGTLMGLKPVTPKTFSKAVALPAACPQLIYGVELEIEDCPHWPDMVVTGLRAERDNSLRNNGMEFITSPMTYSHLAYCLQTFFDKNKFSEKNYSERCSIHVHTNCLNLTVEQIRTIGYIYQMCEKVLYSWVDPSRYNNIFCVPWSQTNITYQTLSEDVDAIKKWREWRKYTGLNLLPLYEQGTIEWRHMSGHSNLEKLLLWCQLIGDIYSYAMAHSLKEVQTQVLELNTNSQYKHMVEAIFGPRAELLEKTPTFDADLEDGVINLKYASSTHASVKKQPVTLEGAMDFVAEIQLANMEREVRLRAAPRIRPAPVGIPQTGFARVVLDELQLQGQRPVGRERNPE